MTSACLHQPNFLPWSKLLAKIAYSDVYLCYDTVQFTKTEFHNRQRLRSREGTVLLTVPVRDARHRRPLCEVQLDDTRDWRSLHLRIIDQEYRRSPYHAEVRALIAQSYAMGHDHLVDLNLDLLGRICGYLGLDLTVVRTSRLDRDGRWAGLDNTDRLIAFNRAVGADEHVTSTWGTERRYIEWDRVQDAGLTVRTQQFVHPTYPQPHAPFVPGLGALDLLFARGPGAADLLRQSSHFLAVTESAAV